MTPEVLAQHQVIEFEKLKDKYVRWLTRLQTESKNVPDPMTKEFLYQSLCDSQTRTMLRLFIDDLVFILEQR